MADLLDPVPARKREKSLAEPTSDFPRMTDKKTKAEDLSETTATGRLRMGSLVGRTDAELVGLAILNDTEAYNELVGRYQLEVRNLARSIVRDYQAAEDLSQDAFIKAYHSLEDLKEPHKFGSWICTILRHTALDHLRSQRNLKSLESLQEDGFEPAGPAANESAVMVLEVHEEEVRTMEALRKLRQDYREIIILKHVEKLSYKEIAKRLNMSVSAVGEKLSRVRALLKRRLEKRQFKDGELEDDGASEFDALEET